jgi:hypothetical protein
MVLEARDSVWDHVRQDQLSAARRTTHRLHIVAYRIAHPLSAL